MPEKPTTSQISHIPILDGRNYTLWSIMMDVKLSARGLGKVCHSKVPPSTDPSSFSAWNQANIEAVQLILSRLHQEIIISIVDGLTVKNAKALWSKITIKFESQNVTNRGRTWVHWQCLKFTGNIEEYIKECSSILFDIAGIGISLPPDIMAYSILGKICQDSSLYDHVIDSMVPSMNAKINPQQVLDKLSEFLRHKNAKRDYQKMTIKEENDSGALLTTSNQFPYKLTYICKDRKNNIKNITHKAENCWAEHRELCPLPCNQFKKKASEAETHQTGLEALLSDANNTTLTSFSLVIDCGATHNQKRLNSSPFA
ncbi:hypothetical protein O181_013175 [Austropuccinia psidii MF-1]|uniref:Retrotransposon Copia-like N-terminal domain-containing protein n=1 Tax=Austropuccinia psidii MF-1 TaxID=1389203 RepID=A0A9Q3BZC1_9BASI|nr:hypothetical protein [Austropuccinia psidii MF-1]